MPIIGTFSFGSFGDSVNAKCFKEMLARYQFKPARCRSLVSLAFQMTALHLIETEIYNSFLWHPRRQTRVACMLCFSRKMPYQLSALLLLTYFGSARMQVHDLGSCCPSGSSTGPSHLQSTIPLHVGLGRAACTRTFVSAQCRLLGRRTWHGHKTAPPPFHSALALS